jgi:uncharacterized protein
LKVISDTGPLLAAADRRDPSHPLAASLITQLGRELLIPDPVVVETDQLLRKRRNPSAARSFLAALTSGEHQVLFLSPGLLRRSVEIDTEYADLNLGLADAAVMACAERHKLPILTFDFRDFRATSPRSGSWRLVVDEARYRDSLHD